MKITNDMIERACKAVWDREHEYDSSNKGRVWETAQELTSVPYAQSVAYHRAMITRALTAALTPSRRLIRDNRSVRDRRHDTCKAPRCWGEYGTPCDRCPMPARTPEQIRRECIAPAECFCGACGEPAAIDTKIPEQCFACDCYLPCEALAAWAEDEIV